MKSNKAMGRIYLSAALVLLMAVSCTKIGQGDYYSDPNAVHFSAQVGSGTKTSPVGSADEQTKFSVGDMVAISDGGAFYNYCLDENGNWPRSTLLNSYAGLPPPPLSAPIILSAMEFPSLQLRFLRTRAHSRRLLPQTG